MVVSVRPCSRAVAVAHSIPSVLIGSPASRRACRGAAGVLSRTGAVEAIPGSEERSGASGELDRWTLRQTGPKSGVGPTAAVEVPGTRP